MDANNHYANAIGMMEMVIKHKDEPEFSLKEATVLLQGAQAHAMAGILRFLLDGQ